MQSQTRPIADPAVPAGPGIQAPGIRADDYLVAGDAEPDRPGVGARIVHGLQIIVIVLLAVVSFAIFWVVGLLLNVF